MRVERVGQVVPDEQIEPPVAVDVDKRRGDAPGRGAVGAALERDVGEGAVPVVAEHLIAQESREVEINPSVVVDVAGRHALPIAARDDPARRRHVGEPQRARPVRTDLEVVAVQATAGAHPAAGLDRLPPCTSQTSRSPSLS